MFRLISTVFCLAIIATTTTAQRTKLYKDFDPLDTSDRFNLLTKQGGISYRLPNDTVPIRYDVHLTTRVDEGNFAFTGNVKINLRIVTQTNRITIHAKQLIISRTELRSTAGGIIGTFAATQDPVTEFLTVQTQAGQLTVGQEYVLEIDYTGTLRQDDQGFYRSSYLNEQGQTVWLATTQFEQTEARHGFPCYDEPGVRAIYGLTITHGNRYHALANMPIKSSVESAPGVNTTVFEDTPVMQSYLNAFVVSDFTSISNAATKLPAELLQSVYGVPSTIARGEAVFALEAGQKIMQGLEKHLSYNYSLPKMDQIGIPNFYWGAMENWGLVTYRESALFYDPATSPMSQLHNVAGIIAHEYAHQWFGNIVSPKWWEFIWLNEGFATLFEFIGVDNVYPAWRVIDLMVVQTCQSVFVRDSYETTRPMTYYVEDPQSVQNIFDFVAYAKSGCVLRMLQHVLTDATFTKGINTYLNEMQYSSAVPDDLYRNLNAAAQTDGSIPNTVTVKTIMDSWANQKGFPVLTVSRNTSGIITLTQERFLLERLPTTQPQTWWVPYNFVVKGTPDFSKTTPDGWIPQGTTSITLQPSASQNWTNDDWIVFNKQESSYYRVNYDARLWDLIIEELVEGNYTNIHLLNRAQLIDDSSNFAAIKLINYDVVFGLMEYLSNEMDYVPWVSANRVLTLVDRVMASLGNYEHLKTFIHHAVQPIFEKLGVANINNEPYLDRLSRNIAVRWACYVGSEECQTATTDRVQDYITTDRMFESDNRNTIFCAGMRGANETVFMALWTKMQTSTNVATRNMLIDAMACSQDVDLLKVILGTLITQTGVNYSAAEKTRIISGVAGSGIVGTETVMAFIEENQVAVKANVALGTTLNNMANWIANQDHLTKLTALLNKLVADGTINAAQSTAAQNLSRTNMQWVTDFGAGITEFLDDYIVRTTGGASAVQVISTFLLLASALLSTLNFLR